MDIIDIYILYIPIVYTYLLCQNTKEKKYNLILIIKIEQ